MGFSDISSSILASFAAAFTQHNRLLVLDIAPDAEQTAGAELLPHRVTGTEALSATYRYDVECLSNDAFLELKDYLGQSFRLSFLLADGGYREITGIATSVKSLGSNGGFSRLSLRLEPCFSTLSLRINSRVFIDQDVPSIVATILQEHIDRNPVFTHAFGFGNSLRKTYPKRSLTTQFKESDRDFIERLLREEGISYLFSHEDFKHTFILIDDGYALEECTQPKIRFHGIKASGDADSIFQWEGERQVVGAETALLTYEYKGAALIHGNDTTRIDQGQAGNALSSTLEDFSPQTHYYGKDTDELERYANLRQLAKDLEAKSFNGQSNARQMAAGRYFTLQNHPVSDQDNPEDRQFILLSLSLDAANNLPADLQDALQRPEQDSSDTPYTNRFTAVRRNIAIVPSCPDQHRKPHAPGLQTATVVGPAEAEIHTDGFGRVKIQYDWQLPKNHPEGGASFDDRSSTWVPVATGMAGAGWGNRHLPRVGQRVIIGYVLGDIDRPLILSMLHAGANTTPAFSGAGSLPANKAQSGIKSKEHQGSGYGELLFDDTTGQVRTKLSSETGKTQLNLGYLTHERHNGDATPRGEGAELRSDEAISLRAGKGMLLSADARMLARGNQLDRAELIGVMQVLESLHRNLSSLANTHKADDTDTAKFTELKTHLENWEKGTNTAGGKPDPKGGQPMIAASAPAGIVLGSQSGIAVAAEHHIDIAGNRNVQMSAGRRWLVRAVESISLFAHQLHVKLVAANGKVIVEAHNNNIEATAAKKIVLTALEEIVLQAPKVTIMSSGAQETWGNGSITSQCAGLHTLKAALHDLAGPGGSSVADSMPASQAAYDEHFILHFPNGAPMKNMTAKVKDDKGKVLWSGTTNDRGHTGLLRKDLPDTIQVEFHPE